MENNFDYKNCTIENLESRRKKFILRDFYGCIYANNVKCVKYLLDNHNWLKEFLQSSWIADMQFYDFDKQEDKSLFRRYKPFFPSKELLELLKCYTDINAPITKSAGIDSTASYISSTMQNKNTVKWEHEGQKLTLQELAKNEENESYSKDIEGISNPCKENLEELSPIALKRLGQMGNSWFVSYMYHFYNPAHNNWLKTLNSFRTGYFKETKEVHKQFLERISNANEAALGRNQIDLSGAEVRRMAKELLKNWDVVSQNQEYKNL